MLLIGDSPLWWLARSETTRERLSAVDSSRYRETGCPGPAAVWSGPAVRATRPAAGRRRRLAVSRPYGGPAPGERRSRRPAGL